MVDYGYGSFGSVGEDGSNRMNFESMNKGITPIFFMEPEADERASESQGRAVYREMERCRLHIAGDSFSAPVHPVDDYIRARFRDAYEHWKRTSEGHKVTGTPLKMWPMATPVQIKELEAIHVFSVEDLANIADVHVSRIPDGRVWREKALAWLRTAADTAAATKFAAENERLRARIEALENAHGAPHPDRDQEVSAPRKKAKKSGRSAASREASRLRMKAMWAAKKAAAGE